MKSTLAIAALALSLAACGSGESPSTSKPATFTYAINTDLGSLDPYLTVLNATTTFDTFLYGTLVAIDAQGNAQPQLAEQWDVTGTEKATFTLREGITCSDGAR